MQNQATMKLKKKILGYFSENLAVPEIHVDNSVKTEENENEEQDNGSEVVFDNLAVPEIKFHHRHKNNGK